MIYMDNAATTRMSERAFEAMRPYFMEQYANAAGTYSFAQGCAMAVDKARVQLAKVTGAKANEIYFTSGGTESDNWALKGVAQAYAEKGKHIIISAIEHHAILHSADVLKRQGYDITVLPVDEVGVVSPEAVDAAIRPDTILVSIMAANNEVGTIEPIAEIGAVCKKHGVLFHTDAVQAFAHIPLNVDEMNIDLLSAAGHKFHGPKGVGIFYARNGNKLVNVIEGGAQERGKRAGTVNVPAISAMAYALREGCENMEENMKKVSALRDRLIEGLKDIPYSQLNGDPVKRLPGNVNWSFEGVEGESLLLHLDMYGIECSSGSACTSESLDPSHVLLGMGVPVEAAHGSLRFSLDIDNTEEQVDYIIEKVHDVVKYYRDLSPYWEDLLTGKREHCIPEYWNA